MEIVLAKHTAFCMGVKRAFEITLDALKMKESVFILGHLIHNSKVIEKLEAMGAKSINELSELPKSSHGSLIISAHGVPPQVFEEVESIGLKVIDTTCPWVTRTQKLAQELYSKGYHVVIIGDRNHTEVKGIQGWTEDKAQVIEGVKDLYQVDYHEKIGIVVQTTKSWENFMSIKEGLKSKAKELKAHNTICDATFKMQKSAVEIAKHVNIMLVVGDFKSANTRRLTELCIQTGIETHQIQSSEELCGEWLIGKEKIGITAGTSTPDWIIDEIIETLKRSF